MCHEAFTRFSSLFVIHTHTYKHIHFMRHFPTNIHYHFLVCCFWLAAAVMSVKSFATLFSFFCYSPFETVFGRHHIVVIILIYHNSYTYITHTNTRWKYIYRIGTITYINVHSSWEDLWWKTGKLTYWCNHIYIEIE